MVGHAGVRRARTAAPEAHPQQFCLSAGTHPAEDRAAERVTAPSRVAFSESPGPGAPHIIMALGGQAEGSASPPACRAGLPARAQC